MPRRFIKGDGEADMINQNNKTDDGSIQFYGVLTKELTINNESVHNLVYGEETPPDPKSMVYGIRPDPKFMVYGIRYIKDYIEDKEALFTGVEWQTVSDGTVVTVKDVIFSVSIPSTKNPAEVKEIKEVFKRLWYPIAVATLSRYCRDILEIAYDKSKVDKYIRITEIFKLDYVDYMLQDFGFRGCSCVEQSIIGGSAHLLNFKGSDTMPASFYTEILNKGVGPTGVSIPASEHSVMTSYEFEEDAMLNIMLKFGEGLFAMVMDSYDYVNSLKTVFPSALYMYLKYIEFCKKDMDRVKMSTVDDVKTALNSSEKSFDKTELDRLIENFIPAGFKVVFRPDSGDPAVAVIQALQTGLAIFGPQDPNAKFKELKHSAVIQGDGISVFTIKNILDKVLAAGFSPKSVAFGMGGGLLQKVDINCIGLELGLGSEEVKVYDPTNMQLSWDSEDGGSLFKKANANWKQNWQRKLATKIVPEGRGSGAIKSNCLGF